MTECANCGRSLNDIARFCPDCGTPVAVQAMSETEVAKPPDPKESTAVAQAVTTADTPSVPAATKATVDTVVESPGDPTVEPPVAPAMKAWQTPSAESAASAPDPPAPPARQRICPACGAGGPAEDLFCGDCGTPLAAPAVAAAPIAQAPVIAAAMGPEALTYPSPATYQPRSGVEDYLSFRALWVTTHAAALFWIAEGANLVYWILDWVITGRWSGAQGFFWSAAGFVLFAVVIRIVTEAAVAASRAAQGRS